MVFVFYLVFLQLQTRSLNLHEYQSKELMQNYGITIQKFKTSETPEGAGAAAKDLSKYFAFLRGAGFHYNV